MEQNKFSRKSTRTGQGNITACANVGATVILCSRTKNKIAS